MPTTIKIAAAASLRNGLPEIITAFKGTSAGHESITFDVLYGSSGYLARQIIGTQLPQIFPDIFLSASEEAMNLVVNAPSPTVANCFNFIRNTLVIVKNAAAGNLTISTFENVNSNNNALSGVRIWLANPFCPDYVPAGIYAKQAFLLYTPQSQHWDYVIGKAINANTLRPDVQATVNGVAADTFSAIGVVYNSDSEGQPNVTTITEGPVAINDTILYPAAQIIQSSQDEGNIDDFLAFLTNPAASSILLGKGFRSLT